MSNWTAEDVGEIASWLSRRSWQFFTTYTFRDELDAWTALGEFEGAYVQRLQQRNQSAIGYFVIVSRGVRFRRIHLHAMLAGLRAPRHADVIGAWRAGWARASSFDGRRSCLRYVAAHVLEPEAEISMRILRSQISNPSNRM